MPVSSTRIIGLLTLLAVLLTLAGEFLSLHWLIYFFKPLATILIITIPFAQWIKLRSSYAFWITIGLFFSLIGDVALIFPNRFFLPGLVAFLSAHIAYLVAFSLYVKFPARLTIWMIYLAIAATSYALLFSNLPVALRLPVAIYSLLLASMAAQSMGRYLVLDSQLARLAAFGGTLFMLSDLLLAFDRFRASLPFASVMILVPYYLAQWLIALSTLPRICSASTST